ncbi:Transposase [Faunimonas pinastri]|uniref:Transposase n=2 Tax=Faunimonas pinastri TaxID=1855383 RepID=A0A1H9H321_9HYPH|nr:Transposase [Faunimonas pinastri]
MRLLITAGQASDKTAVPDLLVGLPAAGALVADRGYDSRAILDLVAKTGGQAHIPTQSRVRVQRSVEPALYRRRNLVERFFCKLKHFRRVATRFDKLARNFLAALLIASTRLWLRAYESTT